MKSWWIKSQGGKLALEARDVPVPQPGPGEVVVRVRAAALNRGEFNPRYLPDGGEKIGGHEAAGEVAAVGEGVIYVKAGDRVMGRARGGFSEYAVMQEFEAMRMPDRLSWEQAAGVPLVRADICLEGGALEVDGRGNAILNESCILNANRNPGMSKAECEKALARFLGIEHIIWLPGMKDADITDSHIDFYAKYIDGQTVLINREHNRAKPDHIITRETEAALAEHFELNEANILDNPQSVRVDTDEFPDFAASYINYYACNGGVIVPEFGDAHTDAAAKEKLQLWYPDREIVAMNIDWIAIGGGVPGNGPDTGNAILGNSIHDNGTLGIDLADAKHGAGVKHIPLSIS